MDPVFDYDEGDIVVDYDGSYDVDVDVENRGTESTTQTIALREEGVLIDESAGVSLDPEESTSVTLDYTPDWTGEGNVLLTNTISSPQHISSFDAVVRGSIRPGIIDTFELLSEGPYDDSEDLTDYYSTDEWDKFEIRNIDDHAGSKWDPLPVAGQRFLRISGDSSEEIVSYDGLPKYPEPGDTIRFFYYDDTTVQRSLTAFAVDGGVTENSYFFQIHDTTSTETEETYRFGKYENGSEDRFFTVDATAMSGRWNRVVIEWDEDHNFDVEVTRMDTNETVLSESVDDPDKTHDGGGVGHRGSEGGGANYDYSIAEMRVI